MAVASEAVPAEVLAPEQPQRAARPALALAEPDRRTRARRAGSRTRSSAGSTPTKKTARQPKLGRTRATTPAAIISPIAQVDCIRPEGLAAVLRRPGLGDERGAGRPLAAHAQAEDEAEDRELHDGGREAAGPARQRVDEDRDHQRARAADAVGEEAEEQAADGRGQQGERVQEPGRGLVHPEVAHQVREHHGVEHHVHGVEHPAEAAGHERAALGLGHVRGPLEAEDARRASSARPGTHGPPALQRAWMRSRAAMAAPRAPAMSRSGTTSKRATCDLLLRAPCSRAPWRGTTRGSGARPRRHPRRGSRRRGR